MLLGLVWFAVLFILIGVAIGTILWGQAYGSYPFKGNRYRSLTLPVPMDWEAAFEVGTVVLILLPVMTLVYGIVITFSSAQFLVDAGMFVIALLLVTLAMDNFALCCRFSTSEFWPLTRGRVYSLEHGDILPGGITIDLMKVKEDIIYIYSLNGENYVGYQIDAHNIFSRPSSGRSALRLIDHGEVLVYYNPDDPETAVLVPGVDWSSVSVLMGMAVSCVLIPLLFRFSQM
jgi:hypothetical protein